MMRKMHSAAMASILKRCVPALPPGFHEIAPAEARALGTQKRMSFVAQHSCGRAYLLFEPATTARDNYFTLDAAWIAGDGVCTDWLTPVYFVPQEQTIHDLAAQPSLRIRASCLWREAPDGNFDAFKFSTASSRYGERLFSLAREKGETSDEVAGSMFRELMEEEDNLTPELALEEVGPAVSSCLALVRNYVLPFFECASECAQRHRDRA